MRKSEPRMLGVGLLVATVTVTLVGCSQARSVEAYCSTMELHKSSYLTQMQAATDKGDIAGVIQAVGSIGDLKVMWSEMADVAPDEIRADTEAVRDMWKKQEEQAADNNFLGGVLTGLLGSGSMTRVDSYVKENCDVDVSQPTDATAEEPVEEAPVVQSTPVSLDGFAPGALAAVDAKASVLHTAKSDIPITVKLDAGEEAEDTMTYGVEAFADSPTLVAVAGTITTQPGGLTPASSAIAVQTFSDTGQFIVDTTIDQSVIDHVKALAPDKNPVVQDVAVAHGTVIVVVADVLVGFDGKTGKQLWTADALVGRGECGYSFEKAFDSGGPITTGGLYLYSNADSVIALDAQTGAQTWAANLGGACNYWLDTLSPTVDSFVVVRANGGDGFVLDATTGQVVRSDMDSYGLDPVTGELALSFMHANYGTVEVNAGHPAVEVLNQSGSVAFTLPAEQGIALGGLSINASFDGRIWISTPNGADVILAKDGSKDSEASTYLNNTVKAGTTGWTLLGAGEDTGTLIRHPGQEAHMSLLSYAMAQ